METTGMPTVEKEEEKTADQTQKELEKMYAQIIYKTTNSTVGENAHLAKKETKFGYSSKFSKPLGASGMYSNAGLNTCVERDKVFDGAKDWMDKIH